MKAIFRIPSYIPPAMAIIPRLDGDTLVLVLPDSVIEIDGVSLTILYRLETLLIHLAMDAHLKHDGDDSPIEDAAVVVEPPVSFGPVGEE